MTRVGGGGGGGEAPGRGAHEVDHGDQTAEAAARGPGVRAHWGPAGRVRGFTVPGWSDLPPSPCAGASGSGVG